VHRKIKTKPESTHGQLPECVKQGNIVATVIPGWVEKEHPK